MPKSRKEINAAYRERNIEKIRQRQREYKKRKKEERRREKTFVSSQVFLIDVRVKKNGVYLKSPKKPSSQQITAWNNARRERYKKNEKTRKQYQERNKLWAQKNKDKTRIYKERYRDRKLEDDLYNIRIRYHRRFQMAFRAKLDGKRLSDVPFIECSWDDYQKYLESMFYDGMTWENYGHWHIDHIVPLIKASSYEHLLNLLRFDNTQPLWKRDNLKKWAHCHE